MVLGPNCPTVLKHFAARPHMQAVWQSLTHAHPHPLGQLKIPPARHDGGECSAVYWGLGSFLRRRNAILYHLEPGRRDWVTLPATSAAHPIASEYVSSPWPVSLVDVLPALTSRPVWQTPGLSQRAVPAGPFLGLARGNFSNTNEQKIRPLSRRAEMISSAISGFPPSRVSSPSGCGGLRICLFSSPCKPCSNHTHARHSHPGTTLVAIAFRAFRATLEP